MVSSSCRILALLAITIGSLDIGFSFAANAKPFTTTTKSLNDRYWTTVNDQSSSSSSSSSSVALKSFLLKNHGVSKKVTQPPPLHQQQQALRTSLSTMFMTSINNRGGGDVSTPSSSYMKPSVFLTSLWGSGGVIYILIKAIKRVMPIAFEPFVGEGAIPLTQLQLGIYVATCIWFAYVEGYKGFQTKFSPLVVKRSLTLQPGQSKIHHFLLAPFYSMGLFHATKKRTIVSWSVTTGVALVVAAVKRLPYPWRNIIDAGVVAGLTWGSLSILIIYLKAWITGQPPTIDPALPNRT